MEVQLVEQDKGCGATPESVHRKDSATMTAEMQVEAAVPVKSEAQTEAL